MANSNNFSEVLPIMTLYALTGYRLMPALNQIYGSFAKLHFANAALDILHKDLVSLKVPDVLNDKKTKIVINKELRLSKVFFNYPNSEKNTLDNISLIIPAYSTIGIVGSTGSGKTTLMDLMLGVFEAEQGDFTVDGVTINKESLQQWKNIVGYVPQRIYLFDGSISANIAFGVNNRDIDQAAVERAAKLACLHEFVVNELEEGYETLVGDQGVRLSGGQCQRIGIARALYHNPKVLFLDEATSALDNITEKVVMEAINSLSHKITIVIIAHRLNTVRQCDKIIVLHKGEIEAQGAYEDLSQENKIFQS